MRFRFAIRDLLWLILAVALSICWWIDRSKLARHDEQASQQAEKYDELLSLQESLDMLIARHRRLEFAPDTTELELKKCEHDIEATKNSVEFLSHK